MADSEHPALKGFSETAETVKETGKGAIGGAIKWGLIGAAAGGALAIAVPALLTLIPGVGLLLGPAAVAGSIGFGVAGAAMLGGAKLGAMVGGALGGIKGLAGSGEKIEEMKQQRIENFERNEARQERREMVSMRRDMMRMGQQRGGVASPALPQQGRGQGMAMG